MSLILDPVNGVHDDNRLENLRIVCANCNATLDTHCGRNVPRPAVELECAAWGTRFPPANVRQRDCPGAWGLGGSGRRGPQPARRRVERPPYEQLVREID